MASWRSPTRGISKGTVAAGTAYDIYRGYKKVKTATTIASAAGGIVGVAARLAVGYVIETIIDTIILKSSQKKEVYYQWDLLSLSSKN